MLTRAANLATQKLAGQDKFKDKSVPITIVDDVLKVRRLRPNKIILSATKDSDGEWKSIGAPNIDAKKDLKILGDVTRVNDEVIQNVEVAKVDRSSKTSKSYPRKSHGMSHELG